MDKQGYKWHRLIELIKIKQNMKRINNKIKDNLICNRKNK